LGKGPPKQVIPTQSIIRQQHQWLGWPRQCLPDVHCNDTCQNMSCNWDDFLSLQLFLLFPYCFQKSKGGCYRKASRTIIYAGAW